MSGLTLGPMSFSAKLEDFDGAVMRLSNGAETGLTLDPSYAARSGGSTPVEDVALTDPIGEDLRKGQELSEMGSAAVTAATALAAVSAYFGVKTQQETLKTQALQMEFKASAYDQAAAQAQNQSYLIIESGKDEISRRGMRAGQERAAQIANAARRNVVISAGSSAEVRASMEIARQMEARSININTLRQANAMRTQALDARNAAESARLSARIARKQASDKLIPALAMGSAAAQMYLNTMARPQFWER
jgi:hypothetical protein